MRIKKLLRKIDINIVYIYMVSIDELINSQIIYVWKSKDLANIFIKYLHFSYLKT